jgi:hypothetical protein
MRLAGEGLLRRAILAVFVLGAGGATVELLLIGHYEDARQMIPLSIFALALALLPFVTTRRWLLPIRIFQWTMAVSIVAGLVGMWLHYQANREFQLEVDPSLSGLALVAKALRAKAPPALAPGLMVEMGLLGLAYTAPVQGADITERS